MTSTTDTQVAITELLRTFKLPTAAAEMPKRLIDAGHHDALEVVHEVLRAERDDRRERRVERLRQASMLPPGKTFETYDLRRLPHALTQKLRELRRHDFVERAANVLAFGLPGTGKSHAVCALGHELVQEGRPVLFIPTFKLCTGPVATRLHFAP